MGVVLVIFDAFLRSPLNHQLVSFASLTSALAAQAHSRHKPGVLPQTNSTPEPRLMVVVLTVTLSVSSTVQPPPFYATLS